MKFGTVRSVVVLGSMGAVLALGPVGASGCTGGASLTSSDGGVGLEGSSTTKARFVEDNVAAPEGATWLDQMGIQIIIEGVDVSVNGGVDVIAEQGRTRVEATARILAMALSSEKANADASIQEVKGTFHITSEQGLIRVRCGHGQTHGSSTAGESGCEKVTVRVPAASSAGERGRFLSVESGSGTVNLAVVSVALLSIDVRAQGDIDATVSATPNGTIELIADKGDDVVAHLPADFAADEIILEADAEKRLNDFPDAKIGSGAGGRGAAGVGLKSLRLTSRSFAGSSGVVKLTR